MDKRLKKEVHNVYRFIKKQESTAAGFALLLDKLKKARQGDPPEKTEEVYQVITKIGFLQDKDLKYVLVKAWQQTFESPGLEFLPDRIIDLINEMIKCLPLEKELSVLCIPEMNELICYLLANIKIGRLDYPQKTVKSGMTGEKILNFFQLENINTRKDGSFLKNKNKKYDIIFQNLFSYDSTFNIIFGEKEMKQIRPVVDKMDEFSSLVLKLLVSLSKQGLLFSIVPNSFLVNQRYSPVRDFIKENYNILSIVELPTTKLFTSVNIRLSLMVVGNLNLKKEETFLAMFDNKNFNKELNDLTIQFNQFVNGVK